MRAGRCSCCPWFCSVPKCLRKRQLLPPLPLIVLALQHCQRELALSIVAASLLGTRWRLLSVYGNQVPQELEITMLVGENDLNGFGGCNQYDANFQRVGHTGFKINKIAKGQDGCPVLRPAPGMPTINVGDWEGSYIRTLQRAGSVEQVGNTLHFYNRSGEPSVIFAKKYGSSPEAEPASPPAGSTPESGASGNAQ